MWRKRAFITGVIFSVFAPFFAPFSAFAVANSVSIACPSSAAIGSNIVCTISGHATDQISEFSAVLKVENLNIQSFVADSAWTGSADNGSLQLTTSGVSESFTIGTLTVQSTAVNATGKISLSNIIFKNGTLTESSVSGTSTSVAATAADTKSDTTDKSSGTTETQDADLTALSDLKIEGFDISFSSDKYTYSLQIPKTTTSLKITATPKNSASTVEITGNENLTDGSIVKIVIANGEAKSIYRIKISVAQAVAGTVSESDSLGLPIMAIVIIAVVVVLIIVAVVVSLLLRKKKRQQQNIYNPTQPPATPFRPAQPTEVNRIPSTPPTPVTQPPVQPTPVAQPSVQPTSVTTPVNQIPPQPPVTPVRQPMMSQPATPSVQPIPQQPQTQPQAFRPVTPTSQSAQPQPTRPISLDELPFDNPNQQPPEVASRLKKPTTPIVFES